MFVQTTQRSYQTEEDHRRIRSFLQSTFMKNGRHETNWPVYRWDYWVWHVNMNIHHLALESNVFFWETTDGQMIALVHPDNPGEAFIQVEPGYSTESFEEELVTQAEQFLAQHLPDGSRKLTIWLPATNRSRLKVLQRRGYVRKPWYEYQRRRSLDLPVAACPAPEGYLVRPLGNEDDLPARSWVSWKAFHPDEPDENYQGFTWYANVMKAPLYRKDLDLVVVAPDGEHAAFCTVWFDPATLTAAFEPVGTHPEHQRRGLGKAVMAEGLRRARALGASLACVGSYSEAAGGLYASMGFTDYDVSEPWTRQW